MEDLNKTKNIKKEQYTLLMALYLLETLLMIKLKDLVSILQIKKLRINYNHYYKECGKTICIKSIKNNKNIDLNL